MSMVYVMYLWTMNWSGRCAKSNPVFDKDTTPCLMVCVCQESLSESSWQADESS